MNIHLREHKDARKRKESAVPLAATIATDLTCRAAGRHTVVRTTHTLRLFARWTTRITCHQRPPVLRRWVLRFCQVGEQIHMETDLQLHAFQPDSQAFGRLWRRLTQADQPQQDGTQQLAALRMSPHVGAPAAGTNSCNRIGSRP